MVISYASVSCPACIGELRGDAQELGKECLCCIRAYCLNYHDRSGDRKGRVGAVCHRCKNSICSTSATEQRPKEVRILVHSCHWFWIVQQLSPSMFVCVCLIYPRDTPNLTPVSESRPYNFQTAQVTVLLLYSRRLPIGGGEVAVSRYVKFSNSIWHLSWLPRINVNMQIPFCIHSQIESTLAVLCNTANTSLPRRQRRMEHFLKFRHLGETHIPHRHPQSAVALCWYSSEVYTAEHLFRVRYDSIISL